MRLPGGDLPARLSDRLHALDYTVEGVQLLVGDGAASALDRDDIRPASRRLRDDGSPLATVVRCFMLAERVDQDDLGDALALSPHDLGDLLSIQAGQATAATDLTPCAIDDTDWLVASDWSSRRTGRATAADHVLGVGGASMMLAQCTVRPQVSRALDVGTGCGVQAFLLADHADDVVATDVSLRVLELARFNAALNGVRVDLRSGDLLDPVGGEDFGLIVSNPPFVLGSPVGARHDYRDFGGVGDSVCRALVSGVEPHLTTGGWCQLLANWEITDADDWSLHPRQWVSVTGLDAWVIQREVQDPAEYVETWLRDAGEQRGAGYEPLYDEWLSTLEARGVVAIGFGLVSLRRGGRVVPIRRFQHVPQQWTQPVAADIETWFATQDWLAADPSGPLMARLSLAADVVLEQHAWATLEPVTLLRRSTGMRWSGPVDRFGVDVLAGCDGATRTAEVVVGVAERHGIPVDTALERAVTGAGPAARGGVCAPLHVIWGRSAHSRAAAAGHAASVAGV